MKSKTFEILYKPYSADVKGYILRLADIYLVVNSRLTADEAKRIHVTLHELVESSPLCKLILLKGDGEVYKTDNLDFLERAC